MHQENSESVRPDNDADVNWLAYRYVVGELSESDALSFDNRLAMDQSAREALAAAVELSQAVAMAGEARVSPARVAVHKTSLRRRERFWSQPIGSLVVSAAAALLLAAMLQLLWPVSRPVEPAFDPWLLAEWTQMRDAAHDDWSDAASRIDASENGWDGLAAMTAPEDFSESSWLLTALAPDAVVPGQNNVHQQ